MPGQKYEVQVNVLNPSSESIDNLDLKLHSSAGLIAENKSLPQVQLFNNMSLQVDFEVEVPEDARYSETYFSRSSIFENRYQLTDPALVHTQRGAPAQEAVLSYEVLGVPLQLSETVHARKAVLPDGYELNELRVAPRLAVNASPATRVVPLGNQPVSFDVEIEVQNNDPAGTKGVLSLDVPEGWRVSPRSVNVGYSKAGQQNRFTFQVSAQGMQADAYAIEATLTTDDVVYNRGYELVDQKGLEKHYLYKPATIMVHGLQVDIEPNLNVGYIMGVGDEVPAAIDQLGAEVSLLSAEDLETGDLSSYDVIVVGTRAYAVRQDLLRFNQRLMDFAENGGHLIVLYQTPEYVPADMAPYHAELPRWAEEVSEEDAPVTILKPNHKVFSYPNKIGSQDFDDWVEQRGSKFFSSWDAAYVPLIESNDAGQTPQPGGWLMADVGSGHFTYFAYAIHRQAPFAVPGALRIFANLLSYSSN